MSERLSSRGGIDNEIDNRNLALQDANRGTELVMIKLNTLMDQRKQQLELTSNMLNVMSDTLDRIGGEHLMTTELIEAAGRHTKRGLFARYAGVVDADVAALRRRAMADEAREDWALALDAYRIAAVLEPGEADHWRGLSRCYRRLGDTRLAAEMDRCAHAVSEVFK